MIAEKPKVEIYSPDLPLLFPEHLEHLLKSAISIEVIKERGYRSITARSKELQDMGFGAKQRRTGILIPLHGVTGELVGHQLRPDNPRENERGRKIKYENPTGASVRLDIPPRCLPQLGDPRVPIWFTEGVKKVDALASTGAVAIGLTGVWGFKGKNPLGGTTILADFDYISFKDRLVYLCFDSDYTSNAMVALALQRLGEHLKRRAAAVRILRLPNGAGGEKLGADDYLAQGHTLQDLIGLETNIDPHSSLRKRSADTYCIEDGRYCFVKQSVDGESVIPLCNFTAAAIEDITRDNGQDTTRYFKVTGRLFNGHELQGIEVPAGQFNNLTWVTGDWGMRAIIAAGQNNKDRLREAIQLQSQEALQKRVYTHTGWRKINEEMVYLNGSGALGNANVQVEMDPALSRYSLPEPEGDPSEAINASYNFINIGDLKVTLPFLAAMYLAPLSELLEPAFTIWLCGPSGSFKSTITALALCHFGNFDVLHLPASWRDTANQLEKLLFLAKDIPLVIDDWAPGQDSAKAREMEVKAEYVVRAQGNRQGRGRMRSDTSSRVSYSPRGVLITSGEQLPAGHSHTARIYTVEVEREDIDMVNLTQAQEQSHLYRLSMAHYILYLKEKYSDLAKTLKGNFEIAREKAQKAGQHPRLPAAIAWLHTGLSLFCDFAVSHNAMAANEAQSLLSDAWGIFLEQAGEQSTRVEDERPGPRGIEALNALLNSGRYLLANKDSTNPEPPSPGITYIGWQDGNQYIYLNPSIAYQEIYQMCQKSGAGFTWKSKALWDDWKRMNISVCEPNRNTSRLYVYGQLQRIIQLRKDKITVR
jgi:hypothetical protein